MSSSASINQNAPKKPLITRFLDGVEYLGNLLPHPITLFAIFCVVLLVASGIAGYFELSVVDPRPEGAKGRAADGMIHVVSLLNADGLELIVTNLVKNFVGFAPFRHRVGGHAGCRHCGALWVALCGNAWSGDGRFKAHGHFHCRVCRYYF
ncbi:hypothetical protein VCSRO38_3214 [Vibrio cholerae]|nr:hypothetical protein VCSRO38_3214 [Vibrio cholerae]